MARRRLRILLDGFIGPVLVLDLFDGLERFGALSLVEHPFRKPVVDAGPVQLNDPFGLVLRAAGRQNPLDVAPYGRKVPPLRMKKTSSSESAPAIDSSPMTTSGRRSSAPHWARIPPLFPLLHGLN